MNRKQLILGASLATFLILLVVVDLAYFGKGRPAQVDQRSPLQRLAYCSSEEETPCIVSFSLDANGKMLISLLTSGAFYPDFYLKIRQNGEQHIYSCQKTSRFATSVYCTGAVLPPGKMFQFSIFSLKEDVLLAEGDFPIIGLALGTPVVLASTPFGTLPPSSPTEEFLIQTPTPGQPTLMPTRTLTPSYPNYP